MPFKRKGKCVFKITNKGKKKKGCSKKGQRVDQRVQARGNYVGT